MGVWGCIIIDLTLGDYECCVVEDRDGTWWFCENLM